MRERAIKIKSYVGNVNIVGNNDLFKRALNFLFISFGVLAICYVYIIGNMVFNIVERKTLEAEARNLSNEVRELELTYLSESNKIDIAFAESLGFKEATTNFATRKPVGINSFGSISKAGNEL